MVTTDKVTVAEFSPHIGKTTTDYKENDMGVYIPNMGKPKTCEDCPCAYFTEGAYSDECQVTHKHITDEKPTDCPLIDIVTCGECKWYDTESRSFPCCTDIFGAVRYMEADGFCSRGERRADEN